MSLSSFVTDFADQAVILPLALATATVLASTGWWRGAIFWTVTVSAMLAVMALLKLVFTACGHLLPFPDMRSPSGHTAAAGAVYGGLLSIGVERLSGRSRWTLLCALGVAVVIGLSRLSLGVHSVPEVIVGGAVGVCGALALARWGGMPPANIRLAPLAVVVVAVMVIFHGFHLPVEQQLRLSALDIWPFSLCRR